MRVGIIGGGPAGLGLAYTLGEAGADVTLFEAEPSLGGLARSFRLGDVEIERYYHFLCTDDAGYFSYAKRLGIDSSIRFASANVGFFHDGVLYPFNSAADLLRCEALSRVGRVRYGAFSAWCAATTRWHRLDGIAAKPWLIDALGLETYRVMWQPLLEVKFHDFHDRISAAWVWHRVHRVARSRGRGSGLARASFGWLEGGTQVLVDALVRKATDRGVKFRTGTPVRRILHDGRRCQGVLTESGETHAFDQVVAAVPLPLFLRMAPNLPPHYQERLEKNRLHRRRLRRAATAPLGDGELLAQHQRPPHPVQRVHRIHEPEPFDDRRRLQRSSTSRSTCRPRTGGSPSRTSSTSETRSRRWRS